MSATRIGDWLPGIHAPRLAFTSFWNLLTAGLAAAAFFSAWLLARAGQDAHDKWWLQLALTLLFLTLPMIGIFVALGIS